MMHRARGSTLGRAMPSVRERFDRHLPEYGPLWRSMAASGGGRKEGTAAAAAAEEAAAASSAGARVPSLLPAILGGRAVSFRVAGADGSCCALPGCGGGCSDPILEEEEEEEEKARMGGDSESDGSAVVVVLDTSDEVPDGGDGEAGDAGSSASTSEEEWNEDERASPAQKEEEEDTSYEVIILSGDDTESSYEALDGESSYGGGGSSSSSSSSDGSSDGFELIEKPERMERPVPAPTEPRPRRRARRPRPKQKEAPVSPQPSGTGRKPRARRASPPPPKRGAAFARGRDRLTAEAFSEFNAGAFGGALSSVEVTWSKRLQTTAGLTRLKRVREGGGEEARRIATIELSTKCLDSSDRLRSTLLHEMCHAAAWLVDGVAKPPHGRAFKKWARIAMGGVPGIDVTTTHDYVIAYKFWWKCSGCGSIVKRHSRSVDVKRHRCGSCRGELVEIEVPGSRNDTAKVGHTPKKKREPSGFSLFVQQQSKAVRARLVSERGGAAVTQPEVMKECGRLWREQKKRAQQTGTKEGGKEADPPPPDPNSVISDLDSRLGALSFRKLPSF